MLRKVLRPWDCKSILLKSVVIKQNDFVFILVKNFSSIQLYEIPNSNLTYLAKSLIKSTINATLMMAVVDFSFSLSKYFKVFHILISSLKHNSVESWFVYLLPASWSCGNARRLKSWKVLRGVGYWLLGCSHMESAEGWKWGGLDFIFSLFVYWISDNCLIFYSSLNFLWWVLGYLWWYFSTEMARVSVLIIWFGYVRKQNINSVYSSDFGWI